MSNQGSSSSLTLPALFSRTLKSLIPIFTDELSTSLPTVQDTLHNAITDLDLAIRMMATLGVFSDNEEMEDVGDSELVYMTVEWIKAEVQGRINGDGIKGRLATLESSKSSYESFLFLLESYSFPTPPGLEYPSSSTSSSSSSASPRDPAARREAKIKQYRLEKEWKDKVGAALPGTSVSSSPLPAVLAILDDSESNSEPTTNNSNRLNVSSPSTSVNPSSSLRNPTLSLLTLLLIQSISTLNSTQAELDLLNGASMSAQIIEEDQERREKERRELRRKQEGERVGLKEEERWRLDLDLVRRRQGGKVGSLIDDRGKPMQPFTILPSMGLQNLSDQARLQAEVFRSPHRLPTMTIDEYLEEERRRGNIITGGGAASENAPTSTEILQLASEQDGTRDAEEKEEEKRRKEEDWSVYTELNKKGAGNTMNRG